MPRFRFTLQAVLDHREMIEQQKQKTVAVLESQRVALERQIRQSYSAITAERAAQRERLGASDLRGARQQAAAAIRLTAAAQRAAIELAGLLKRLEAARAELLEAAKRRKAVDLLRERRFEEWKLDQDRRDLAAVDELAVMRAGRRDHAIENPVPAQEPTP